MPDGRLFDIQKMEKKRVKSNKEGLCKPVFLLLRYIILLGLMFTLPLIYEILTPLTVHATAFLLNLFYQVSIFMTIIKISPNTVILIIPPCVAGSAYLLLLILNLTVSMKSRTRIHSILFSVIVLFILNILRIFLLAVFLVNNSQFFDFTHKLFWYFLSTLFVVIIWFFTAYLFKIKQIPVYSDIKYLINNIKKRK